MTMDLPSAVESKLESSPQPSGETTAQDGILDLPMAQRVSGSRVKVDADAESQGSNDDEMRLRPPVDARVHCVDRRVLIKDALIASFGALALGERIWRGESPETVQVETPGPVTLIVPELPGDLDPLTFKAQMAFSLPVPGISLLSLPSSRLPNALRLYRRGIHYGLDLYRPFGDEVCAIADGIVTTADEQFTEIDPALHQHLLRTCTGLNTTPPDILRRLTGRSIEVDHGTHGGMRVRSVYGHLSSVSIGKGTLVKQGDLLGAVGNSGTTAGVSGSREDAHLHLEVWLQRTGSREVYLGQGMEEQPLRRLLLEVFSYG